MPIQIQLLPNFVLFGSLGINLYGNRQIAYLREDKIEMSKTFWEIVILRFFTVALAYVFLWFMFLLVGTQPL